MSTNPISRPIGERRPALEIILSAAVVTALVAASWSVQVANAVGAIRYVSPTGVTSGTCNAWGTACDLQYALGIANSGDQIWAQAGVYYPTTGVDRTISFVLENGVAIYGGFGGFETAVGQRSWTGNPTTLSGEIGNPGLSTDNSYHVVVGSGTDGTALLDGFYITAGSADSSVPLDVLNTMGGGMLNDGVSSPTLVNLFFIANSASFAGGAMVNLNFASPKLTNVIFGSNSAPYGGALYNLTNADPELTDVTFAFNTATGGAGAMFNDSSTAPKLSRVTFDTNSSTGTPGGAMVNQGGASPVITNATFYGNSGGLGGAVYNANATPAFNNVTFNNNSGASGGAMYNDSGAVVTIDNTILWGDAASEVVNNLSGASTIDDSVLQGACPAGSTCNNVYNADPLLQPLAYNGGATRSMALGAGSSALDSANSAFGFPPADSTCASEDQREVTRPQGPGCDIGAYEHVYASILYASPTGLTSGYCESWATACMLDYVLPLALKGQQIWAMAGTYAPTSGTDRSITFALKNGVTVYGGFAGNEIGLAQRDPAINVSILDGDIGVGLDPTDNSCHVVSADSTDSTAVLDGFAIVNGYADSGCFLDDGGGMVIAGSPTLRNLTFANNWADSFGGGVYSLNGAPNMKSITFANNSAGDSGGGMYHNTGNANLTNVTFHGNTAGVYGGGLKTDLSNLKLTNATFNQNTAPSGGGAIANQGGNPVIVNSILWGNIAGEGNPQEFLNISGAPNISRSVVSGGCASITGAVCGSGNLTSDPKLMSLGDYGGFTETMAIQQTSPAVDAASDASAPKSDQRNMARPQGAHADIGAFELGPIPIFRPGDGAIVCPNSGLSIRIALNDLMRDSSGSFDPSTVTFKIRDRDIMDDVSIVQDESYPAARVLIIYPRHLTMSKGDKDITFIYPTPSGTLTFVWGITVDLDQECDNILILPETGTPAATDSQALAAQSPTQGTGVTDAAPAVSAYRRLILPR